MTGPRADASIAGATTPGQSPPTYVMWSGCSAVIALSDADLTKWHDRGVDGFVCNIQWLRGFGGSQDFTADPNAALTASNYSLQRQIRDSKIVERAAAKGISLYLGFYLVNFYNTVSPLAKWFDDAGWNFILPKVKDISGAAKMLGFKGL